MMAEMLIALEVLGRAAIAVFALVIVLRMLGV
jgi:hypothetical protein